LVGWSVFRMFLNYFEAIFRNFLQRHIIYVFVIVVILLISCKSMFKKSVIINCCYFDL